MHKDAFPFGKRIEIDGIFITIFPNKNVEKVWKLKAFGEYFCKNVIDFRKGK